jgi:hypothetical protein
MREPFMMQQSASRKVPLNKEENNLAKTIYANAFPLDRPFFPISRHSENEKRQAVFLYPSFHRTQEVDYASYQLDSAGKENTCTRDRVWRLAIYQ